MDGTMVSLFGDYKHGRRYKAEQVPRGGNHHENARTMPTLLPGTQARHGHRRGKSYPQVRMSRKLLCTATPPPSLQSQSLPKISLHGDDTRQQHHHSNHSSSKGKHGLAVPTVQCRTTQSLPSLSNPNSNSRNARKRTERALQRSSTFDLFRTSKQGRRPATHSQNFSWDFGPRTGMDIKNPCLPKHGDKNLQTTRPVHLYMSVEMMDKLLEKRKGLRSDDMLNELIGLPPTKVRVSVSRDKNRPRRENIIKKQETVTMVTDREIQDASNCKEVTTKEGSGGETNAKTTPKKQPRKKDQRSKNMETASEKHVREEDYRGNEMEEFEDEEEEELGDLGDDEGSDVFDGCEDDNEEEEAEEIREDEVDSDDEERGSSQDEVEEEGEQEEDFEDEDLEDREAKGGSEDEVEEEFEDDGSGDDNDGEEAERQDDDDEYDAADEVEIEEGQEVDEDEDADDDDDAADEIEMEEGQGDDGDDDDFDEDGRTVEEDEREEELDELENEDEDDLSDGDDEK